MDIAAAHAYLNAHSNLETAVVRAALPTLERIGRLVEAMDHPQRTYPVIHITGTNGKGSTARLITSILAATGLSVGTFTSPHLERVNERISRNGEPVSDEDLAHTIGAVAALDAALGIDPSYFEILTAAGFRWFADQAVDVAVVEVGMAGRWDATNVADGTVAVITNVSRDHTEYLGEDLAGIAAEKAGIIKPGSTVILGETAPALAAVFDRVADEVGAGLVWRRDEEFGAERNRMAVGGRVVDLRSPGASYEGVFLPLHGAHQGDNAALAVAAVEAFFARPLGDEVVREGCAKTVVPGRFEILGRSPMVVLDGAHNPAGARTTVATLGDFGTDRRVLVLGFLGRDPDEMLAAFDVGPSDRLVIACRPPSPRATPSREVAAAAARRRADVEIIDDLPAALSHALGVAGEDDAVIVTGSLWLVGAARSLLVR